jgi:hypothetical protein
MEGHSSRLEQVEDRIPELEDKKEIKGKTEKLLVKPLKTCERNMQGQKDLKKNDLMLHLKLLEKPEQANPKTSRTEIIKIRAKTNEIETKKDYTKNK